MFNPHNQAVQQPSASFQRYQAAVGLVDSTGTGGSSMPVASRPVAAPLAPSQRQQSEWGMNFTGGDKKTQEMAGMVKMKVLPFYEIKRQVIKQRSLVPTRVAPTPAAQGKQIRLEAQLEFGLNFQDCNMIAGSREMLRTTNKIEYGYQLQLRFGVLKTDGDQDDEFPPSMILKVNGRPVPLPAPIPSNYPGTPPRQPSKPLNITSQAKLRPVGMNGIQNSNNTILVSWMQDIMNRNYVISLNLVKKLTSNDLFEKLKRKGSMDSSVTKKMIESVMKVDDDGLAPAALKVSVACPVGKSRMVNPCRSAVCPHIQCFDALLYLQMNEKKPVWSCPVCNKKILYDDITIDGYFVDIIKDLKKASITDIEINANGSWNPIEAKGSDSCDDDDEDDVNSPQPKKTKNSGGVTIKEDETGNKKSSATTTNSQAQENHISKVIETICISDDSDDECAVKNNGQAKPVQKVNPIPATVGSSVTSGVVAQSQNPAARIPPAPPARPPPPPQDDDDDDVICLSD